MKFGPIPIDQAVGKILGHNIAGPNGRRLFRKGHTISQNDLAALHSTGRTAVYVAQLEPDDVDEDSAARRIADAGSASILLRTAGTAAARRSALPRRITSTESLDSV